MNALRLMPVVLSFLLLGAHFYRAGYLLLLVVALVPIALLPLRKDWVPPVAVTVLILGALEWLRTAWVLVSMRMDFGLPWQRMALILGIVALLTASSALLFRTRTLRQRYSRRNFGSDSA